MCILFAFSILLIIFCKIAKIIIANVKFRTIYDKSLIIYIIALTNFRVFRLIIEKRFILTIVLRKSIFHLIYNFRKNCNVNNIMQ